MPETQIRYFRSVVCAMCMMLCACSAEGLAEDAALLARSLVEGLRRGEVPSSKEIVGRYDILSILKTNIDEYDAKTRQRILKMLSSMEPQSEDKRRVTLSSDKAIAFVVDRLEDPDQGVRNCAAEMLVDAVADEDVARFAASIISNAYDDVVAGETMVLLLGKTGDPRARKILREERAFRESCPVEVDMALAKLGDAGLAKKAIAQFEDEKRPEKKAVLAKRIGFIGGRDSALGLARNIRSSSTYIRGGMIQPVVVDYVEALGMIYPAEQVFRLPLDRAKMDSEWYDAIEKKLQSLLGVSWDAPRPKTPPVTILPTPPSPLP